MPPEKDDRAYLWDMLDAARAIESFVAGKTAADYARDRMLRNAVERNLEIIGEAARRVSSGFQGSHPAIPWRKIVGLRNVLAHDYGEIKHERIWDLAQGAVPELAGVVATLLPNSPRGDKL